MTGHDEAVIDEAELRRMSRADRRQLARFLAELDEPDLGQPAPVKLHPNGEDLTSRTSMTPGCTGNSG